MAGYIRVDTSNNIADGNVISAADLDNEFDGVQSAFNASTGHTHGGAVGEGAPITKLGPTQDVTISTSLMAPKTTNTVDLGSSSLRYKDLFLAGNAAITGTLGVTGATTLSAALTYGGVTLSNAVTGTGNMVLSASPTLTGTLSGANASLSGTLGVTGVATLGNGAVLGTPASVTLTNATGLPIATGVSGLGTGVATALAVNVGSAGAPVVNGGALGTPSSGTVTNLTGTASININGTVGATTASTGAFTTLSASSTVSGAGFSTYLASPPAIGGTAAAAVSATTLTTSGAVTHNAGTANGVAYLNGSKVLTTGSALTFDGTNLSVVNAGSAGVNVQSLQSYLTLKSTGAFNPFINFFSSTSTLEAQIQGVAGGGSLVFALGAGATEQMRLTSTGLGIGTSSPSQKLTVSGAANFSRFSINSNPIDVVSTAQSFARFQSTGADFYLGTESSTSGGFFPSSTAYAAILYNANATPMQFYTSGALRATLDSSGNLGLGVTPSAWVTTSTSRGMQFGRGGSIFYSTDQAQSSFGGNYYQDGASSYRYLTTAFALRYSQSDFNGSHQWFTAASGTAGNAISFTQAMTLDASGNLGVGTTSPSVPLHVSKGAAGQEVARFNNAGGFGLRIIPQIGGSGAVTALRVAGGESMSFETDNTERARITSGGDLLVGKTSVGTAVGIQLIPDGSSRNVMANATNSFSTLEVYSTGAAAFRFYVGMAGTVYATNTTISAISDQRFKENVRNLDDGLDAIMALKPRKFDWKAGKGKDIKDDRGFIAQEFEQVFPEMIDNWKDPAPEGEEPYKSVRADLIPVLVKAIQELKAEFDAYKATHP